MALAATNVLNVMTTGSDTANSGAFDPGQTAGMFTDGAATVATSSAPVFTSASYNFVAGDVNAYLFIGAGTNWLPGWYKIVSVASNAATLNATSLQYQPTGTALGILTGCATVASPTGATWSIDYSQQASAKIAFTDLASAGAGLTASSAGNPLGKQMVGNSIQITSGTNFTAGLYTLASVAAGVGTFRGAANMTTGVGSGGTGGMGGSFASCGMGASFMVAGNTLWCQYSASTFDTTSTTSNVSGGRITLPTSSVATQSLFRGYETVRGDEGNRPTLKWAVNAASSYIVTGALAAKFENFIIDGNRANFTNTGGYNFAATSCARRIKVLNTSFIAIKGAGVSQATHIEITNATNAALDIGSVNISLTDFWIHDNGVAGITISSGTPNLSWGVVSGNTGVGIAGSGSTQGKVEHVSIYGNTSHGWSQTSSPYFLELLNVVFEGNGGLGYNSSAVYSGVKMTSCAFYNNSSGKYTAGNVLPQNISGEVIPTVSVFVNAAGNDFRLNNATGGGALLRGTGFPQTFPGLTWANYPDIGAAQHAGNTGFGFGSGMNGGLNG